MTVKDIKPMENFLVNMNMNSFFEFINKNKPHWADDVIQPWDETDNWLKEQFVSSHYWCANTSINIFQVVGTAHYQYQGKTWLQFVNGGKRMDINIPLLIKNPTYYSEVKSKQPMMYFKTWDGINYFVNNDGNHRTVLCRFYFHFTGETQIHGVTVEHFKLNDSFYALFKEVSEFIKNHGLSININPVKTCCGRDDTAGWKIDHFNTTVDWSDFNVPNIVVNLTEPELKAKFEQLKMSINQLNQPKHKAWYKRFLGR